MSKLEPVVSAALAFMNACEGVGDEGPSYEDVPTERLIALARVFLSLRCEQIEESAGGRPRGYQAWFVRDVLEPFRGQVPLFS